MLSSCCERIRQKYNISIGQVKNLVLTLSTKINYALYYRNLQLYMDLGLQLKKVHRALQFKQSPWLKQYIDFNTQKRTTAKNLFEKDFFKLKNSVFGKTIEDIRKRVDVKLITDGKKIIKIQFKTNIRKQQNLNLKLIMNLVVTNRTKCRYIASMRSVTYINFAWQVTLMDTTNPFEKILLQK